MVTLNDDLLRRTVDGFRAGLTYAEVAQRYLGVDRRLLFRWLDRSKQHRKPFFIVTRYGANWYHIHVERARKEAVYVTDETLSDCTDDELFLLFGLRDRFKRDENGDLIRRPVEEEPELDQDIQELQRLAREPPKNPRPNAPVSIMRTSSGEPPERITGGPAELSRAERERAHPRAYTSGNADLKPLRPERATPAPRLDASTIGRGADGEPPEEGRFTVATQTLSAAQRRAGTVSFDGTGIRRW